MFPNEAGGGVRDAGGAYEGGVDVVVVEDANMIASAADVEEDCGVILSPRGEVVPSADELGAWIDEAKHGKCEDVVSVEEAGVSDQVGDFHECVLAELVGGGCSGETGLQCPYLGRIARAAVDYSSPRSVVCRAGRGLAVDDPSSAVERACLLLILDKKAARGRPGSVREGLLVDERFQQRLWLRT